MAGLGWLDSGRPAGLPDSPLRIDGGLGLVRLAAGPHPLTIRLRIDGGLGLVRLKPDRGEGTGALRIDGGLGLVRLRLAKRWSAASVAD